MSSVTVNHDQRLFVFPSGPGFSCLGFDVCYERARQYASLLGRPDLEPVPEGIGTVDQYQHYLALEKLMVGANRQETLYDPRTPEPVCRILDSYLRSRARLRLFLGDEETGRDWLEENDVIGTIGRSMGPIRIPLLIANSRNSGGGALLSRCVVRLIDVASKRELWRHPRYHQPTLKLVSGLDEGYAEAVLADGKCHAQFRKSGSGARWIAFMRGEHMAK